MTGPVFNNNTSGGQNQINQGMEVSASMNNACTPEENRRNNELAVETVSQALPQEVSDVVMPRLVEVSLMTKQEQEADSKDESGKIASVYGKIKPYILPVVKKMSIFGAAALKVMKSENPWIAGLFALAEDTAKAKPSVPSSPSSMPTPRTSRVMPRTKPRDGGSTFGGM